jgi:hypothetical protein
LPIATDNLSLDIFLNLSASVGRLDSLPAAETATMLTRITRDIRRLSALLLSACLVQGLLLPAAGDTLADFNAAMERVSARHRAALATLESSGQHETAAQVHRFRQSWQEIVDRFGKDRPAAFAGDERYTATLLDVDVRTIGVLLVIDLGNREAARDALAAIGDILADLKARAATAQ